MLRFKAARRQSPALKPQGELTASERRVIRLMDAAMQQLRDEVDRMMTRLADAVAHRSVDQVVNMIPVDPWLDAQEPLQNELLGELLDAGSRVKLPAIQKATLAFSFDRSRPESAAWAQSQAGSLIVEVMDGQRTMVRDIVAQAQTSGLSPTDVARQIRNGIGLTTTQAGWVDNFYNRTLSANIANGMSMSEATRRAQSATDRYQQQIHRYRSTTIARTEIMRANSEGRQQSWAQGLAEGWISPNAKKEWIAEADACEICSPFNGTRIGIKEQFGIGEPPAHPNCRCDVLLVDEIPRDIQQMTDAELDAELDRLITQQSPAPSTQTGPVEELTDWEWEEDIDDWLNKVGVIEAPTRSMNPGAHGAWDNYAGNGYIRMNSRLRSGTIGDDELAGQIRNLQRYIDDGAPLRSDIRVYRGMHEVGDLSFDPGSTFVHRSFMSTSAVRESAVEFAQGADAVLLDLTARAGTKAVVGGGAGEVEIIFSAGSKVRILRTEIVEMNGRQVRVVYGEIIP